VKSGSRLSADAYLGLGANLGKPRQTFEQALDRISGFATVTQVSRLYQSAPYGFADQPPFVNAAARISTTLPALDLLTKLQAVEQALGKKIVRENGPRVIDLDLLLYGDMVLKTKELTLPHPEIQKRDFVLLPLIDLNPELYHPQWGAKTLKSALGGLQERFVGGSPEDWKFPS
jgi:2-amino-4-hydroxy-6-hydroxymethyldihydropteridine diphosphokinase